MTVFTIGHSTRIAEEFVGLLQASGVDQIVDVRRFPFSRRYPHFNGESLAVTLAAAGIGYRHEPALGGRRGRRRDGVHSPHTLWREEAFANYADYAETPEFREAFDRVRRLAEEHRPAVMCAEAVWWRCHRRIIADYLIAAGLPVAHILAAGKVEPARLTPDATIRPDSTVLYRAPTLL
jgi:uncharacterized protein (DUF488 family)